MNSNKHSRLIAAVCIIVLAVFSIFVFPFILAASPGNMDIEVIDMEDDFNVKEPDPVPESEPGAEYEQPSAREEDPGSQPDSYPVPEPGPVPVDPDPVPEVAIDSNAISMDQAIEKAWELFIFPDENETTPAGENRGHSTVFLEARYMESDDPAGDPSWFLLFEYRYWGVDYSAGHYEMVEINAITGKWIGSGMDKPVYSKALDEFDSWDDIKRGMDFWWTIEKLPSGEIIRTPLYHEEYDYGG